MNKLPPAEQSPQPSAKDLEKAAQILLEMFALELEIVRKQISLGQHRDHMQSCIAKGLAEARTQAPVVGMPSEHEIALKSKFGTYVNTFEDGALWFRSQVRPVTREMLPERKEDCFGLGTGSYEFAIGYNTCLDAVEKALGLV